MPYVDLHVREGPRVSAGELQRLGYASVAVSVDCEASAKPKEAATIADLPQDVAVPGGGGAKAAKKAKQYAAAMANALVLKGPAVGVTSTMATGSARTLTQLRRLTLKVNDMNVAQSINSSPVIKTYDLVAAEAGNAKIFQFLCEQADVDVITFDLANRLPFQLKKPWIDTAMRRGVHFELCYAACLGDSAGRRYFFSNASQIARITQGRHLILSSGATRDLFLRSPYDVINLGLLAGLTYGQAMGALTVAPMAALEHARRRRGLDAAEIVVAVDEPMEVVG